MFSAPTCVLGSSNLWPKVTPGHDPEKHVEIGSLTKVITGTALMRMSAAGMVSPADPVEKWLPAAPGTGITLQHLASHTAGLPRVPPGLRSGFNDPWRDFTDQALRDLLARLDQLITGPPGEHGKYSNLGYAILGAALSSAAGAGFEELAHEHVLAPLGVPPGAMTARPSGETRLLSRSRFRYRSKPWTLDGAVLPAAGMWASCTTVGRLITGVLIDRTLGAPAPTWHAAGPLLWHNGATRRSSIFTGAFADGEWIVMHRLSGAPQRTDRMALAELRAARAV
ncbi:class A beta-lactamase-related serine hydrolase [Streptomyces radicis]|uniref:Class A beta-lactamase-related serine hydrolase n=1 Tax=Streptomyces radicis TaxID=1750517 RepID=A0A3A9W6F1_9ACTN|nr:class A beta-lactamase-related serine hydrolase [Streptomyces radicis]RKN21648.1 class A beta-lactamase-related serine hydrolase [Streptomyces radicis]